ncbi:hypothetical protein THAOC_18786 [Thalassiosira oceanica]|uniref:Uncharacterized protein n=1 Tax=Thalassiosira oceanica TaxID=159749 RepID=K0S402_THAOC|nr:hypothetical protein THAOC_18786 [Thalassiosira oceanica]|eukprot:EJK60803.1 hypothetical protein THAOC_18786 [Thalassiosira oceanica]
MGHERPDLNGDTCVVNEYLPETDEYKVVMEHTREKLVLGPNNLKRRDRTRQDPGYYIEVKANRIIRREFDSNEECQAYVASITGSDEVDDAACAKADQAAAELLSELGLDGDDFGAKVVKGKSTTKSGKKKKRGKKNRK